MQNSENTHNNTAPRGLVVIGPDGRYLTRDDLPPANTKRWVIRRKAEVVAGVRAGLLTLSEACNRYSLSIDEFLSWQHQLDSHGLEGLKVTRIGDYRPVHPSATDNDLGHGAPTAMPAE
jgi:hypothetical protein